jgi:KUP system potassium uptake protein
MLTWRKGEQVMDAARLEIRLRSKDLVERIKADPPLRIPGTAVVLGRMTKGVPLALTQNLKHNHVLQQRVLLVAVTITETPRVSDEDRVVVTPICEGMTRVELLFGFMEQPNVPKGLALAATKRSSPPAGAWAWRAGVKRFSHSCITTPSDQAHISRSQAGKSWRSASNSKSDLARSA